MTKARGRNRVERRLVSMAGVPDPPSPWVPPALSDCHEEVIEFELDATNRVFMRLRYQHRVLVDFALMHQTRVVDGWSDVSRVDCCHGEAHQHLLASDGSELERKVLMPLWRRSDVADVYDRAYSAVMDEYEEHLRRWQRVR